MTPLPFPHAQRYQEFATPLHRVAALPVRREGQRLLRLLLLHLLLRTHPLARLRRRRNALPFPLSFTADIGYRVEPVNSGVTRITMIYSLYPAGRMSRYQYYIDSFQRSFLMGMSGLGTMLSQIPEYHVFNLIERIVNSLHADATNEKDSASTVSSVSAAISTTVASGAAERDGSISGAAERDGSVSGAAERDGSASDPSDSSDNESGSLSEKVLLPPYITNTVAHASECDLMVRAGRGRDP